MEQHFHEILHGDASGPSAPREPIKFSDF